MTDLSDAALDAAVARVLDLQGVVYRPNGQPAHEYPFDPEGPAHEFSLDHKLMWVHYKPSRDGYLAMGLQEKFKMIVYPDPDADLIGTERWVAGFNFFFNPGSAAYSPPTGSNPAVMNIEDAARGATPMEAVCRAIVHRAAVIRQRAWHRANMSRQTRTPFKDFESNDDRAAYLLAMTQQLAMIEERQEHPEVML